MTFKVTDVEVELGDTTFPVSFEGDPIEVDINYIAPVVREVEVRNDEGEALQDPETGATLTKTETVEPGRFESEKEAVERVLREELRVADFTKGGFEYARVLISYTVRGQYEMELEADTLEGIEDEYDVAQYVNDNSRDFEDEVVDSIGGDYNREVEFDEVEVEELS